MKWPPFNLRSLPTQIVLSFVGLVVLTAAAAGLPAIWSNYQQVNRQAWAQIDQGVQAARALYSAKQNEVVSLATLTAQRPTLRALLTSGDQASLTSYLLDLQKGAGFDMVTACGTDEIVAATTAKEPLEGICQTEGSSKYKMVRQGEETKVWMLAPHDVTEEGESLGKVIVGVELNNDFALAMRSQTGLEHSIYYDGKPIATSSGADFESLSNAQRKLVEYLGPGGTTRTSFMLDGDPYYASQLGLGVIGLETEIALPAGDILATQQQLALVLVGSMVATAVLASVLGAFLARRISQPLTKLAESASTLSRETLDAPIAIRTSVEEVSSVARALEAARVDLKQTLTRLQKERDWGEHLIESIVEGVVTLDAKKQIQYFSAGAERITGAERSQVLGRPIDEFFRVVDGIDPFSSLVPAPGERQKINVTLPSRRQAILAITGAKLVPAEAGESESAMVFRDVSEEEAMNRLLGQFLSNVAHEFRTPLSALAASIELLIEESPDLNKAEVRELLGSLHLGILGLETLIDNLLESASIEAGRFRVSPAPCDLREIIAEAIRTMDSLIKKYGQRLALDLPTTKLRVQADARRTAQVLVNLLSNAIKYGPSDSEIQLKVEKLGDHARVEIADRGPGIPAEHRGEVFVRFVHPGVSNENAKAGAGLGLSVVKAIVEAQGGQVGVTDRAGGGAVFWFTLPLAKTQ